MWELDCEESWAPKNWCFWTMVLEKTLESPLDCKEIQLVHPKGNQSWTSLVDQTVKHLPTKWETRVPSLGWKNTLEKEMATHSSTLAWKIPKTEEPGRLQSIWSQRVRHDWETSFPHSLNIHCKDWCWSWNSNILATWCEELTHLERPWCWKRLKARGEGDDRGWDGWMASPT